MAAAGTVPTLKGTSCQGWNQQIARHLNCLSRLQIHFRETRTSCIAAAVLKVVLQFGQDVQYTATFCIHDLTAFGAFQVWQQS